MNADETERTRDLDENLDAELAELERDRERQTEEPIENHNWPLRLRSGVLPWLQNLRWFLIPDMIDKMSAGPFNLWDYEVFIAEQWTLIKSYLQRYDNGLSVAAAGRLLLREVPLQFNAGLAPNAESKLGLDTVKRSVLAGLMHYVYSAEGKHFSDKDAFHDVAVDEACEAIEACLKSKLAPAHDQFCWAVYNLLRQSNVRDTVNFALNELRRQAAGFDHLIDVSDRLKYTSATLAEILVAAHSLRREQAGSPHVSPDANEVGSGPGMLHHRYDFTRELTDSVLEERKLLYSAAPLFQFGVARLWPFGEPSWWLPWILPYSAESWYGDIVGFNAATHHAKQVDPQPVAEQLSVEEYLGMFGRFTGPQREELARRFYEIPELQALVAGRSEIASDPVKMPELGPVEEIHQIAELAKTQKEVHSQKIERLNNAILKFNQMPNRPADPEIKSRLVEDLNLIKSNFNVASYVTESTPSLKLDSKVSISFTPVAAGYSHGCFRFISTRKDENGRQNELKREDSLPIRIE